jgi:hypothetical protein
MICTVDKNDKHDNTWRRMQILSRGVIRSCERFQYLMEHRKWIAKIARYILNLQASHQREQNTTNA